MRAPLVAILSSLFLASSAFADSSPKICVYKTNLKTNAKILLECRALPHGMTEKTLAFDMLDHYVESLATNIQFDAGWETGKPLASMNTTNGLIESR